MTCLHKAFVFLKELSFLKNYFERFLAKRDI